LLLEIPRPRLKHCERFSIHRSALQFSWCMLQQNGALIINTLCGLAALALYSPYCGSKYPTLKQRPHLCLLHSVSRCALNTRMMLTRISHGTACSYTSLIRPNSNAVLESQNGSGPLLSLTAKTCFLLLCMLSFRLFLIIQYAKPSCKGYFTIPEVWPGLHQTGVPNLGEMRGNPIHTNRRTVPGKRGQLTQGASQLRDSRSWLRM
jgi:hypothetical protein